MSDEIATPRTDHEEFSTEHLGDLQASRLAAFARQLEMELASLKRGGSPESERARFEQWVSASPYERSLRRCADAWPGQYYDLAVQLAWEAWQASKSTPINPKS